jgi:hypothetical protein
MAFQLPLTLSMPTPHEWMQLYAAMDIARTRKDPKGIRAPPFPLILGGTMFSGRSTIYRRWIRLIKWANQNGFESHMARRLPHRLEEEMARGDRLTPPVQPAPIREDPSSSAGAYRSVMLSAVGAGVVYPERYAGFGLPEPESSPDCSFVATTVRDRTSSTSGLGAMVSDHRCCRVVIELDTAHLFESTSD